MTFHDLIQEGIKKLSTKHPDTAQFEIYHLICHIFKLTKAQLLTQLSENVESQEYEEILKQAIDDRLNNKPVDLIIGHSDFLGQLYHVEEGVLLPRPETELLVQQTINQAKQYFSDRPFTCIELGFGSGVISIECAKALPNATCYAWDISEKAYNLAQKNAGFQGIDSINWFNHDFFTSNWKDFIDKNSPFLFISNPPYIPTKNIDNLDTSVTKYDPVKALDGGDDGLDYYREIINDLCHYQCMIFLEIGYDQSEQITKILHEKKITNITIYQDINNFNRVLGLIDD